MLMDPFRPMREMERLFEETLGRMRPAMAVPTTGLMFAPCDVCESREEFLIRCALPGVRPEDVEITSHQDTVTIRGRVSALTEAGEAGQVERHIHVAGQPGQQRGQPMGQGQPTQPGRTAQPGQQPQAGRGETTIQPTGQREMARREEAGAEWQCLIREIPTGRFSRTITLPAPVAAEQAEARFEDGILTLRLPKTQEARPKQIPVRGE